MPLFPASGALSFSLGAVVLLQLGAQLLDELPGSRRKRRWHLDLQGDHERPATATIEPRNAVSLHREDGARLGTRWHGESDGCFPIFRLESRHADLAAEGC